MSAFTEPVYFGCLHAGGGHHPHEIRDNRWVHVEDYLIASMVWRQDGTLCPTDSEQREGIARYYHLPIYDVTVIAFWDRSVDCRMGSNSAFWLPGHVPRESAIEEARKAFPSIFERFNFTVVLDS